jgi:hypothetical protein
MPDLRSSGPRPRCTENFIILNPKAEAAVKKDVDEYNRLNSVSEQNSEKLKIRVTKPSIISAMYWSRYDSVTQIQ